MDVYGLIGDPVEHSLSPALFEAAFEAAGVDAVYATFRVDVADLAGAIGGARALGIAGLNVTIPHKEAVLDACEPTAVADEIGAANVLDLRTDPPLADNTDAVAMATVLDGLDRPAGHALLVGAGGAARAYASALSDAGWSMTVANRTPGRAAELAGRYPGAEGVGLERVDELASAADLVLNATPVGLDADVSPLAPGALRPDHVVIDAVYRPNRTRLLRDAAAAGAHAVAGRTLLLEQAVASYERWREEPVPRAAMAAALERAPTS